MAMKTQLGSKASICTTCGSNKNKALLLCCIKCHISSEHRYCFAANPDKVDNNFPYVCPKCVVVPVAKISPKRTYEFRPRRSRVRKPKRQRVEQPAELVDQELDVPTTEVLSSAKIPVVREPPQADLNNDCNLANRKEIEDTHMEDVLPGNETGRFDEEDSSKSKDQDKQQVVPVVTALDESYAKPILEPSWRGSLEIRGEKIYDLAAHLSSNACLIVSETVKLMCATVSTKMVSRLEIWPKRFHESAPTVDSIGIFLFPESENGIKAFDKMMGQIIELDRALKVLLDNAELLLFSSTLLPLRYRRFKGKFYMWGVFTARKDATTPSICVQESVTAPLGKNSIHSSDSKPCLSTQKICNPLENWRMNYYSPLIKTSSDSTDSSNREKADDIPSAGIEPQEEVKEMVKIKKVLTLPMSVRPFQPIGSLVRRNIRSNTENNSPKSLEASSFSRSPDKPISTDEKIVGVAVSKKENMDARTVKVEIEGMCHGCWKNHKLLKGKSAEFNRMVKAKGLCFKCGGADHLALTCTAISDIICLNCGELTTAYDKSGKETKKDGRRSEFLKKAKDESLCFKCGGIGHVASACTAILENRCYTCNEPGHHRAACPKLQGGKKMGKNIDIALTGGTKKKGKKVAMALKVGSMNMGKKVDMALKGGSKKMGKNVDVALEGGVGKSNDEKASKKFCDFCGIPGHLRLECGKFISTVREMKNCTRKEARLFCRDFEAVSNACNSFAVGGPSPSNNSCNNAGEVKVETHLPPNNSLDNAGEAEGSHVPPVDIVCTNSKEVGEEKYVPPNNTCHRPPKTNACNSYGEVGGGTYLPPNSVCSNGSVGGYYHPPMNDLRTNFGGAYLPPSSFFNNVGGIEPHSLPSYNVYNHSGWGGETFYEDIGRPYPFANNVCYNGGGLGRGSSYPTVRNGWAGTPYLPWDRLTMG